MSHPMLDLVRLWNVSGSRGVYQGSVSYREGKEHRWTLTYFPSGRHEVTIIRYQKGRNRSGSMTTKVYPMRGDGLAIVNSRLRHEFPC